MPFFYGFIVERVNFALHNKPPAMRVRKRMLYKKIQGSFFFAKKTENYHKFEGNSYHKIERISITPKLRGSM